MKSTMIKFGQRGEFIRALRILLVGWVGHHEMTMTLWRYPREVNK